MARLIPFDDHFENMRLPEIGFRSATLFHRVRVSALAG
jgi:hypothetical protein